MRLRQGDIFWMDFGDPAGLEPGYARPVLIVQNNVFNESNIGTVVVCDLTTNLRRGDVPGNVLLAPGERDLPEQGVVNVSQVFTVHKRDLRSKIGALDPDRVREVVGGLRLLLERREIDG